MEELEQIAEFVLLRSLGFAALGIGTLMFGLSFDLGMAFNAGAVLTLLVAAVLFYLGLSALSRDVRDTHAWIIIKNRIESLKPEQIQPMLGGIQQRLYYLYARRCLAIALGLWGVGAVIRLLA